MKKHNLKWIGKLIKVVILILTIVFIYLELFHKRSFIDLLPKFRDQLIEGQWLIYLVILMMPFNWGIETVKWKRLLVPFQKLKFNKAFMAVMTGVSVSFFTPNRVGEFGGRILYLDPDNRVKGTTATIIGSISQLAVTILLGLPGMMFYFIFHPDNVRLPVSAISTFSILGFFVTLFVYLRSGQILNWFSKWKLPETLHNFFLASAQYNSRELWIALGWSTLRYVVFCTQLGIVMFAVVQFDPQPHLWEMFYIIPFYFFTISLVPTVGVSEVGTRGVILSQMLSTSAESPDLLFAGMLIWVINIILPAAIGMFSVWAIKIRMRS